MSDDNIEYKSTNEELQDRLIDIMESSTGAAQEKPDCNSRAGALYRKNRLDIHVDLKELERIEQEFIDYE